MSTDIDRLIRFTATGTVNRLRMAEERGVRRPPRTYGTRRLRRPEESHEPVSTARRERKHRRPEAKEEEDAHHRPVESVPEGGRPVRRRRLEFGEEVTVDLSGDDDDDDGNDAQVEADAAFARALQMEDNERVAAGSELGNAIGGLDTIFGDLDTHMRAAALATARGDFNATRGDDEGEFSIEDSGMAMGEGSLFIFLEGIGRMMANRTAATVAAGDGAGADLDFSNIMYVRLLDLQRHRTVRAGRPLPPPVTLAGGSPSDATKKAVIDAGVKCAVCLTAFTPEDKELWDTRCSHVGARPHVFHEHCIRGWHNVVQDRSRDDDDNNGGRKVTKCPLCKADITVPITE